MRSPADLPEARFSTARRSAEEFPDYFRIGRPYVPKACRVGLALCDLCHYKARLLTAY
jgi:hypothetical protein